MIRIFTISVEFDDDEPEDVKAVDSLAAKFEEQIALVGLALDDLSQDEYI